MDAQVRHGAHGGLLLVEEPGGLARVHAPGLRPAVSEGGAEGDDVPDGPLLHQLPGLGVGLGKALVVANHQVFAALLGGGHHGLALLQGGGHGLFAQHVLARFQGGDGDFGVGVVGGADAHRVDVRVGQQVPPGGVDLAAVLLGQLPGPVLVQVVIAPELRLGVGGVLRDVAHLGDFPAADDSDVEHDLHLAFWSVVGCG